MHAYIYIYMYHHTTFDPIIILKILQKNIHIYYSTFEFGNDISHSFLAFATKSLAFATTTRYLELDIQNTRTCNMLKKSHELLRELS